MIGNRNYDPLVFKRGFVLSQYGDSALRSMFQGKPYFANLEKWEQTFFGPCTLWVDPLLKYSRTRDNKFGVGVLGLCVNPFDGLSDNGQISLALHTALSRSRQAFFDYLDQLTGSFIILYRENDDVFLLQDTAATKPVYYYRTSDGTLTATGHAAILHYMHELPADPRAQFVYSSKIYKQDPSRYLPGMITPYEWVLPLTANNQLVVKSGNSQRFFPREDLPTRPFEDRLVDEIAEIMVQQSKLIGKLQRPLRLAITGGRDSRVSAATFSGQPHLSYYSFHMPSIGHLTKDVEIAKQLADIEQISLNIYDLEKYNDPNFQEAFKAHSPRGIWPAAALCYLSEFSADTIHIRSTVSEIGRAFYSMRAAKTVTSEGLARTYTVTEFFRDTIVIESMEEFIRLTDFDQSRFFNYNLHDMFYWEHRNSKWQNVLCTEAEMATDVFIPFNNRNLLKLFMSVPYKNRVRADIHLALCNKLKPDFKAVEIF